MWVVIGYLFNIVVDILAIIIARAKVNVQI